MTLRMLYEAIGSLLDKHGDEPVYADITTSPVLDPMPPIECVYAIDGFVCIGD